MVDSSGLARGFNPSDLAQQLQELHRQVNQMLSARTLESASIGSGGLSILAGGSVSVDEGGAFLVRDASGATVARYGKLVESSPGEYGLEVLVGGTWVHIGDQVATWDNLAGIPADFGPLVVSKVPAAQQADAAAAATNATRADKADGVTPEAFVREVAGVPGSWYAMYMHSNGTIGRASSTEERKTNIRPAAFDDPYRALAVDPLLYDRLAGQYPDSMTPVANPDEFGALAEQVQEYLPELAEYYGGELVGIRHQLGWLALVPAMRDLRARLDRIEEKLGL